MIAAIIVGGVGYGLISGMLGLGGGIILMPLLLILLSGEVAPANLVHTAVGTSIAIMAISSLINVTQHMQLNTIDMKIIKKVLPGSIFGVLVGTTLGLLISAGHIKLLMGLLLVVLALSMFMPVSIKRQEGTTNKLKLFFVGFVVGAPSALLGIGGGSIMGPVLNYFGFDIKKIVGTIAFNTFVTASIALVSLIFIEVIHLHNLVGVAQAVDWKVVLIIVPLGLVGVYLGGFLMKKMPGYLIRYIFVGVLLMSGILMLY
jgi:uncharacterized membrane protein YfcA